MWERFKELVNVLLRNASTRLVHTSHRNKQSYEVAKYRNKSFGKYTKHKPCHKASKHAFIFLQIFQHGRGHRADAVDPQQEPAQCSVA